MGHTNSTANLSLPQFIGTDKPTWLGDVNGAFSAIDDYAGTNDAAVAAVVSDASSAIAQAASAVSTANAANTTAGNASTAATNAVGTANNAVAIAGTVDSKVGLLADLNTTDRTSIVNAINEVNGKDAGDIAYDNSGSGLTATNVQAAIDEVAQGGGGGFNFDVLYTNSDDTQDQAAGTLATLTDQPTYNYFIAKVKIIKSVAEYFNPNLLVGANKIYFAGSQVSFRNLTVTQSGGTITFVVADAEITPYGGSSSTNNSLCVVSEIYGVR